MTEEDMVRIKRVLSRIARDNHLDMKVPLPVWDDTATLIGVGFFKKDVIPVNFSRDKQMGPMSCRQAATFTLNPVEQMDDAKIAAKAELAVQAMQSEIICWFQPNKAEKAA